MKQILTLQSKAKPGVAVLSLRNDMKNAVLLAPSPTVGCGEP